MAFLAICTALYDYTPQAEGELSITEGELLYILEKGDEDDWWKAKKKAEDEDEEEPVGLIPNNYVEDASPTHTARALFDYSRQTEEELSFAEDYVLQVYDVSDPDWTLVGFNGEYGFVPANYIETIDEGEREDGEEYEAEDVASPPLPQRPAAQEPSHEPEPASDSAPNPAASLAAVIGQHATRTPIAPLAVGSPAAVSEDEEAPPPMPRRPDPEPPISPPTRELSPQSPEPQGILASPPANRATRAHSQSGGQPGPGGYHLYNINEMVAVMGKMKKMPTTLGINLGLGVILVMPEKKRDGPQQEWTAEKLTHYSIEGKHVFMELVKPSKSFDFHAGAKDTAEEIVASLGELRGIAKAEGLREVITAGSGGLKKGQMLYDFMAQGDDEVTVADGDEVVILDDTLSEEWWKVRRVKNGKEGVVPSSYVEVTGLISSPVHPDPTVAAVSPGLSTVERNRREEERLTREAVITSKQKEEEDARSSKRAQRTDSRSAPKSKPDPVKLRTWTDRSGSFKVEAQFIGLKDGKIHLHKVNGIKIAVPVAKMSLTDIEYVERATGRSLDEEKPLADIKTRAANGTSRQAAARGNNAVSRDSSQPEYDWFDFFLKCGVSPYQCERYSYNFSKDSMDESVLPDINPTVLRNLGLKEGDILRVMKYLDNQFNRTGNKSKLRNVSFGGEEVIGKEENGEGGAVSGGLFSGPGGALKNNTARSRPAPPVQTNDNIDSKTLEKGLPGHGPIPPPKDQPNSPEDRPPKPPLKDDVGFEDNAWDVKPSKTPMQKPQQSVQDTQPRVSTPPTKASPPPTTTLTPGMADLSLLTKPLEPTKIDTPPPVSTQPPIVPVQPAPIQSQSPQSSAATNQQGANPTFFSQLSSQPTGLPQSQQSQQVTNMQSPGQFQFNPPRQRPQAPTAAQPGALMPPPPARPLSAPQNASMPNNFSIPALQPQLTGIAGPANYLNSSPPPPNLNQLQQMPQMQSQFTGFNPQGQVFNQPQQQYSTPAQQPLQPQMTSFQPQQFANNNLQPQVTGYQLGMGGLPSQQGPSLMPQATGSINSMLPPAMQPQSTGINGYNRPGFGQPPPPLPAMPSQFAQQQQMPPVPPIPQQPTVTPLIPQKTGPAPNVKFGIQPDTKRLAPQPTGRRANLSQATPENPFGY